jgi:tetratricopeptide (TPR) repeat protein
MHTIFRIDEIKQIDDDDERLWQVELSLMANDDQQLHALTERIRKDTSGPTGWHRLGGFLVKLTEFHKAEQVYEVMLTRASDDGEKALLYH